MSRKVNKFLAKDLTALNNLSPMNYRFNQQEAGFQQFGKKYLEIDLCTNGSLAFVPFEFCNYSILAAIKKKRDLQMKAPFNITLMTYCWIRLPGILNFLLFLTMIFPPAAMVCVTFKIHSCPAIGSMMILPQDGRVGGGILLLSQFVATFQLPDPVNV